MAKRGTKTESKKYNEGQVIGNAFQYDIRLYPESKRESGKLTTYFMYLTINTVLTINCYFCVTDNNMWIKMPQYKVKDDYKNYIFLDEKLNKDLDKICEVCESLI